MDDAPWRHGEQPPMNWQNMAGGAPQQQQWAHHSPQAGGPRRGGGAGGGLWDANALAENLGDLGLGGGPPGGAPAWAPPGGQQQPDFGSGGGAKIWSDPHMGGAPEQHGMHHAHMYPQGGMMNGMMDPNAGGGLPEWGGGGMRGGGGGEQQQMWSDPIKQEEGYWKQQQQQGGAQQWGGQQQGGPPRWPPQMGGPPPPPHHARGGMVVNPMGGWNGGAPNGMMGGGGHKPPMWDNGGGGGGGRHMGGGGGGMGGRGGGHRGSYQPRHGGMDMSVPPPMDMQGMMQQRPPPGGGGHMWKPEGSMGGGPNGMRGGGHGGYGGGQGGQMGGPPMGNFMGGGKQQDMQMGDQFGQFEDESMKFNMGGGGGGGQSSDDLMWHDPNGELKKWQRDTGVSVWGDPDKAALRPIQNWIIGENEEEDLEVALARCPIPPKRNEPLTPVAPPGVVVPGSEENTQPQPSTSTMTLQPALAAAATAPYNPRLPPIPSGKRTIVVTGWGDLPDNDPNNPNKLDAVGEKWGEAGASDTPWYMPSNAGTPFGGAGGGPADALMRGGAGGTEHIADQLRVAVEKGYLDMAVLTQQHLPPAVLAQMNSMLAKIPALEQADQELEAFLEAARPPGEVDDASPPSWMTEVQKMEYNSLMIKMTTAKIEVSDLSKKMQFALKDLREQGALPAEAPPPVAESAHDNYSYSFLG